MTDALDRWPVLAWYVCVTMVATTLAALIAVELGGAVVARFYSWRRWFRVKRMIARREGR